MRFGAHARLGYTRTSRTSMLRSQRCVFPSLPYHILQYNAVHLCDVSKSYRHSSNLNHPARLDDRNKTRHSGTSPTIESIADNVSHVVHDTVRFGLYFAAAMTPTPIRQLLKPVVEHPRTPTPIDRPVDKGTRNHGHSLRNVPITETKSDTSNLSNQGFTSLHDPLQNIENIVNDRDPSTFASQTTQKTKMNSPMDEDTVSGAITGRANLPRPFHSTAATDAPESLLSMPTQIKTKPLKNDSAQSHNSIHTSVPSNTNLNPTDATTSRHLSTPENNQTFTNNTNIQQKTQHATDDDTSMDFNTQYDSDHMDYITSFHAGSQPLLYAFDQREPTHEQILSDIDQPQKPYVFSETKNNLSIADLPDTGVNDELDSNEEETLDPIAAANLHHGAQGFAHMGPAVPTISPRFMDKLVLAMHNSVHSIVRHT